jgi:hypothetical protein
MRAKPNTDQFRLPGKDPSDFLESGAADLADQVGREKRLKKKRKRLRQKLFASKRFFVCR